MQIKLTTIKITYLSTILAISCSHYVITFHFDTFLRCTHEIDIHGAEEVKSSSIVELNNVIAILIDTVTLLVISQITVSRIKIGIYKYINVTTTAICNYQIM